MISLKNMHAEIAAAHSEVVSLISSRGSCLRIAVWTLGFLSLILYIAIRQFPVDHQSDFMTMTASGASQEAVLPNVNVPRVAVIGSSEVFNYRIPHRGLARSIAHQWQEETGVEISVI